MHGPTEGIVEYYRACSACGLDQREAPEFCDVNAVERESYARCDAISRAIAWLRKEGYTMPPEGEESVDFLAYINGAHAGRFYRAPAPLDHVWEVRERAPRVRLKGWE